MSKEQLNVRVSPIYVRELNEIIEAEAKKGRIVTKAALVEEAIKMLSVEYSMIEMRNEK